MARTTRQVSPSGATGGRVDRARSALADAPTRRRRDARAELVRGLDSVFEKTPQLVRRHQDIGSAVRYLQTVRGFKPLPPPMSPAEKVKLGETQADLVVGTIRAMLDGIGITDEQHARAIDIAIAGLRAASNEGWEPL